MVARKLTLGQLASVGEGAIGKLAQNPVTHKALEGAMQLKERVEKLVNGLESVEQRLAAVEKRLDALEKPKRRTPAKSTTAKATTRTAPAKDSSDS
jgi:phage shock protein A